MAKPIQGTKQADLNLLGTNSDDTIQGKDGNDFITGGKGNDNIDGGDGIDTAVYSGNIADYSIDVKGTGNDKVTVSDHVLGRDGVDQLKHIELLQFNDGVVDLQHGTSWHYLVDAELDASARKPGSDDMINGSGIPATHFGIARNEGVGVELGFGVHHRGDSTVDPVTHTSMYAPTDSNGYADGVLTYTVQHGQAVTGGATPKAEWSWDPSIATGLNGQTTNLHDFNFKLLVDLDPSANTNYLELHLAYDPVTNHAPGNPGASGFVWEDSSNNIIIPDDDGVNPTVTQNSQNMGFYPIPGYNGGNGFPGNSHFDFVLQAFDQANVLIAQNHIHVDVV